MYKSVLVATDGSQTAGHAVRVAIELAAIFEATLHVVNIHASNTGSSLGVTAMTSLQRRWTLARRQQHMSSLWPHSLGKKGLPPRPT